ncbi:MAG TPA: zinc ribbon domain-containing protein [Planctomycetota bacterium]|nr:zinc ribbon domain-containing protein [Planctomycetota bacterium]
MPTYVYAPKGEPRECDVCSGHFEYVQKMSDDALKSCPKCGKQVERVITAPNLNGVGMMAKKPSNDRMAAAGFTQYKKHGKGYYEKQFGQGPNTLHG